MPRIARSPSKKPSKISTVPIKKCDCNKPQHICRKCSSALKRAEPGSSHCRQCQSSLIDKLEEFYSQAKAKEELKKAEIKKNRKIIKQIEAVEEFGDNANPTTQFKFIRPEQVYDFRKSSSKPNPIHRVSRYSTTRYQQNSWEPDHHNEFYDFVYEDPYQYNDQPRSTKTYRIWYQVCKTKQKNPFSNSTSILPYANFKTANDRIIQPSISKKVNMFVLFS